MRAELSGFIVNQLLVLLDSCEAEILLYWWLRRYRTQTSGSPGCNASQVLSARLTGAAADPNVVLENNRRASRAFNAYNYS